MQEPSSILLAFSVLDWASDRGANSFRYWLSGLY